MDRHPGYPFDPKSTVHVRPGDFWAVPTGGGERYCCGQVLALSALTGSRSVIVGLLDWCDSDLPTAESIAGSAVLSFGIAHVRTVRETGGMLLGNSEPPAVGGLDDPDLSVWGYRFIANLADRHFGRQVPENSADPG